MTFKDLQIGDKFKFGPNEAVVCIKTSCESEQHKDAGEAKYDINYVTKAWPVWDDEAVVKII